MSSSRSLGPLFGWVAVGVTALAGLLAAFAIPVFLGLLAMSGAGALALISRKRTRIAYQGILCGCAIPLLFIAYLNRDGPGEACTAHIGVACTSSEQQSSPWPWAIAGVILLAVGAIASIATKRAGREDAATTRSWSSQTFPKMKDVDGDPLLPIEQDGPAHHAFQDAPVESSCSSSPAVIARA